MNKGPRFGTAEKKESATYLIFGLFVRSTYELPFASVSGKVEADLHLEFEFLPEQRYNEGKSPGVYLSKVEEHYHVLYLNPKGESLLFIVSIDESMIKVQRSFEEAHDCLAGLLGTAIPLFLRLRSTLLIHASALRTFSGVGFLVAGNSGAGKSTLTSMLVKRNVSLLSDDCSLVDVKLNTATVRPGFPLLKLSLETIEHLNLNAISRIPVFKTVEGNTEHWLKLEQWSGSFYDSSVDVKVIYILSGRSKELKAPKIESVTGLEKLQILTEYLYGNPPLSDQLKNVFAKCGQLASQVRIARVYMPDNLECLENSAVALLADIDCAQT